RKLLALDIEQEQLEFLVGAMVVTQTVHTLHDIALAHKFLSHIEAVVQAAHGEATKRLEHFVRSGQRFPEQMEASRPARAHLRIKAERYERSPDKPVTVPVQMLNPHAVLTLPPLKLGPAGYTFRGFGLQVDVSTEITRTDDDGSKAVFRWEPTKTS